jgi:hypothetical protein
MKLLEGIAVIYAVIGLVAVFAGPAAKALEEELSELPPDTPAIKLALFRTAISVAIIALWPPLVPSAARDRARRKQEAEIELLGLMRGLAASGTDQDEIPGAVGEFGLCATNPIPTHTPFGSRFYLSRLRAASGGAINYVRRGSTIPVSGGHPVDIYTISDVRGQFLATIYVSPYHRRNSQRAPEGFQIADLDIDGSLAQESAVG